MENSQRHLPGLQLQEARSLHWLSCNSRHRMGEGWIQAQPLGFRAVRIIVYSVLFWLTANLAAIIKEVPCQ